MVCVLDISTHKTGTSFTKPVDPILGQALDTWQARRPSQPPLVDRRTGERVKLLFAVRARRVSSSYINNTIISMLCRKAGVPAADVRGNITSYRAGSTIASQLYNVKEPMTLFELQAWLGHRSPQSTQYYAKISPITLTRAYTDAGYFARNGRQSTEWGDDSGNWRANYRSGFRPPVEHHRSADTNELPLVSFRRQRGRDEYASADDFEPEIEPYWIETASRFEHTCHEPPGRHSGQSRRYSENRARAKLSNIDRG